MRGPWRGLRREERPAECLGLSGDVTELAENASVLLECGPPGERGWRGVGAGVTEIRALAIKCPARPRGV